MDTVLCFSLGSLLLLIFIGMPIALAFFFVGFVGLISLLGINPAISLLGKSMYFSINSPSFAALPLFILMGAFAAQGGFAERAYKGLYRLTSKIPGALAIATCFACGFFGAVCGSALATTAVFGKVALPEMDKYKYDRGLSLGVIASAGTFASMIPPSSGLIVYAMFTEVSIGKLFLAGVIPGALTAIVYSISIFLRVKRNPELAPIAIDQDFTVKEKIDAIKGMWPIALLIFIVLGGIYSGLFTTTEAAAVGALATLALGIWEGSINRISKVVDAVKGTGQTSAMVFLIIIGAIFLSRFVALGQVADRMVSHVQVLNVHRSLILGAILLVWFLLGMIMEPDGIRALTLPLLFPLVVSLGYDPIWFGIITQKLAEIACVTPPVGLNTFTMKAVAGKDTPIETVFRGIWPFVICDLVVLALLIAFPEIALWLPNKLL
jgi:C4-dicarboxylate transporter DctM subunit